MSPRVALSAEERSSLVRLLATHEPGDGQEESDLAQVQDFVSRHENPFDRRIGEGHLTGSAFLLDPRSRLLLTHHRA